MIKKYIVPTLLIIFAFALLVGSIRMFINSLKDSATNLSIDSLEPFNEVIHAPDSYNGYLILTNGQKMDLLLRYHK